MQNRKLLKKCVWACHSVAIDAVVAYDYFLDRAWWDLYAVSLRFLWYRVYQELFSKNPQKMGYDHLWSYFVKATVDGSGFGQRILIAKKICLRSVFTKFKYVSNCRSYKRVNTNSQLIQLGRFKKNLYTVTCDIVTWHVIARLLLYFRLIWELFFATNSQCTQRFRGTKIQF